MIAVKEKVTFERFTLDFYITLQTYQGRLVRANQCPFNSGSAISSVKRRNREGSFCNKQWYNSFTGRQN